MFSMAENSFMVIAASTHVAATTARQLIFRSFFRILWWFVDFYVTLQPKRVIRVPVAEIATRSLAKRN